MHYKEWDAAPLRKLLICVSVGAATTGNEIKQTVIQRSIFVESEMAGTGLYYGYDELPIPVPPIVDHPHERTHQHQSFLNYLARRRPDPNAYPNYPDTDVRDALGEYLVEIEVPGIRSAKDISVHWTSTKSLVISGTINRPPWDKETETETPAKSTGSRSKQGEYHSPFQPEPPYLLVGERKIGAFRRVLNFPIDVDMDKMTAKLEAGLLRLKVPKHEDVRPKKDTKVNVEQCDD